MQNETMVERVAKALWANAYHQLGSYPANWEKDVPEASKETWRNAARDAIETMRKPTAKMDEKGQYFIRPFTTEQVFGDAWEAAVNAALED